MRELFLFIIQYGKELLAFILYIIISYISIGIKNIYKGYVNEHTKKSIAELCVNACEQLHSNDSKEEKFKYASKNLKQILLEKNIKLSDTEIKVLIESFCYSLEGGNND